jgi:hypothetical protein
VQIFYHWDAPQSSQSLRISPPFSSCNLFSSALYNPNPDQPVTGFMNASRAIADAIASMISIATTREKTTLENFSVLTFLSSLKKWTYEKPHLGGLTHETP